jgi:hypothetical protein
LKVPAQQNKPNEVIMRVGVVFFSGSNSKKLSAISNSLADGIRSQGHQVDIIDGNHDSGSKLTVYNYIAIGIEGINFFGGKIPSRTASFLSNSGLIRSKRSYAYTIKSSLRPQKNLARLMTVMEHEGLYLKKSDIISVKDEALNIGKRLHIS